MKKTAIIPYSPHSHGAKLMAKLLDQPRLPQDYFRSTAQYKKFYATHPDETPVNYDVGIEQVINWGCGNPLNLPAGMPCYNKHLAVAHAVNKVSFFKHMVRAKDAPRVPAWTSSVDDALKWVKEGKTVMARTITEGKGGQGILFYDDDSLSEWLQAPLYVEFILNIAEYRMHFAFGKHIYSQKKALPYDADRSKVDMRVRSHRAGFFFLSEGNFELPDDVIEQGKKAYVASGLDFCALDIVYNKYYNKAYVLEANTAMGIDEGATSTAYVRAFQENLP